MFVCVENTFRSIIAEAIFNTHAPKGWCGESAGVRPVEKINPVAVGLLHEIGIEVAPAKKPRLVTPALVEEASRVVTFGSLDCCPVGATGKSEDWPIPGSVGKDGALRSREERLAIRGEIERRVLKLIHRMQREAEPNNS